MPVFVYNSIDSQDLVSFTPDDFAPLEKALNQFSPVSSVENHFAVFWMVAPPMFVLLGQQPASVGP